MVWLSNTEPWPPACVVSNADAFHPSHNAGSPTLSDGYRALIDFIRLDKVKIPGGVFSFHVNEVATDHFGTWLHGPAGAPWTAPHDAGALPFDVLLLLSHERHAVGWWVDDPSDHRLEIDVCLPPMRTANGWEFVDLELDPVRHEDGTVEIEDFDEFNHACNMAWISPFDADTARSVASDMAARLKNSIEPWGMEGWRRLDALRPA